MRKAIDLGSVLSIVIAVGLVLSIAVAGCGRAADPWEKVPGGPAKVLVSFPPLYCFAKSVAGDDCGVLSLLTTVGPHDHKPTADDTLAVRKASLFLINGLNLDDFVSTIVNSSRNRSIPVVEVAKAIPKGEGKGTLIKFGADMTEEEKKLHAGHGHGEYDPHAWLGIDEAILMVEKIRDELQKIDPLNKAGYQKRADAYIVKLRQLQADGLKLLEGKQNKTILTQHESLAYFARSFGLKVAGAIQLRPGIEPDAAELQKLLKMCREQKVQVIAVEPQYSKGAAERLQEMARKQNPNLSIVVIDPIETAEPGELDADYYTRKMRENLEALAKHLK